MTGRKQRRSAAEMEALRESARRLEARGYSYRRIGEALGVDPRTAWKLLNPEALRRAERASNEKRRLRKRQWEEENDRMPCRICGRLRGVGAHRKNPNGKCIDCLREEQAKFREAVAEGIRARKTVAEVAQETGHTEVAVKQTASRLRKLDPTLGRFPYRRGASDGAGKVG